VIVKWMFSIKFISVFTDEFLYVIIVSHSQSVLNKDCQCFIVMHQFRGHW